MDRVYTIRLAAEEKPRVVFLASQRVDLSASAVCVRRRRRPPLLFPPNVLGGHEGQGLGALVAIGETLGTWRLHQRERDLIDVGDGEFPGHDALPL
eukprot:CAMPEP_0198693600 /NCGR_PEP_ID=MMETSP1468-20131203/253367_1 /TAXON_ID=1461545 /ORGANISM="Mantoniella sp, Strain CCMP1436" /LENGTH=95 /DNA_ID=CAMNT_0044448339 /DNA_START=220 /DNA_END=503 /DNA_ORIENTATION=-